ncbi:hypothetical protein BO70DRAFT_9351 [Aspergillus heteromorphus CBS 117.55]|uniref:Uncharacterized protein n=1 Tax=Aspergillus heteromorphus CBS 117.55 TaxID=1448321 RepID=A0A317X4G5_9EURO|nr:uncharacterized protein BO70DRAFT_9351 [Aspergillus heteromorphus CBS 117.55]PWY92407.1 hypothetical protein BO70DRAFT_9351 [Aspergillus heteromorphus CBS 117.55]
MTGSGPSLAPHRPAKPTHPLTLGGQTFFFTTTTPAAVLSFSCLSLSSSIHTLHPPFHYLYHPRPAPSKQSSVPPARISIRDPPASSLVSSRRLVTKHTTCDNPTYSHYSHLPTYQPSIHSPIATTPHFPVSRPSQTSPSIASPHSWPPTPPIPSRPGHGSVARPSSSIRYLFHLGDRIEFHLASHPIDQSCPAPSTRQGGRGNPEGVWRRSEHTYIVEANT